MRVLIYRDELFRITEPYILNQSKNLQQYTPNFLGLQACTKENYPTYCLPQGFLCKFEKIFYRLYGFSPTFLGVLKRVNPDIIHAHFGFDSSRFVLTKKYMDTPMITTFHGTDALSTDEWKKTAPYRCYRDYPKRRKALIDNCTLFIAISDFVRKKMLEQGFPPEKVVTHYIGIDTEKFKHKDNAIDSKNILFVGRLIKNKGCHLLIEAFKSISEKLDITLTIVGEGPEKNSLFKSASGFKNIRFIGEVNQEKIIELLSTSKVLCVPSIPIESGASEGLGLVFLEAQSMGIPVVSFNTGGIPEAVIHEKTGLLSQPGISTLISNLELIFQNETLYKTLSINAVKHIQENFDIKRQTYKLEEIYTETIKKKRGLVS